MAPAYIVENGELVVAEGNAERYRGRPDGYLVEEVVAVRESRDAIVLLRYGAEDAPMHFPNLVRVTPDGEIRWRALPPEREPGMHDAWVEFRWTDRAGLTASSWSCFYCEIDPVTGTVDSAVFTK
jgi:hypothetical protein